MNHFFERINSIGIKKSHSTWERNTIHKVNVIASTGFLNTLSAIVIGLFYDGIEQLLTVLFVYNLCVVFYYLLLIKKNFIYSSVFILSFGFGLAFILSIYLGLNVGSYMIMFPLLFSAIQIFSTRKTLKYLTLISVEAIIVFGSMLFFDMYHGPISPLGVFQTKLVFGTIIFFALLMSIQFNLVIGRSTVENEENMNKLLKEKEVILSEMFHRVKNNMNVIISILNLKVNLTKNEYTRTVLEEITGRIYAMAIIHERIFKNNEEIALNMQEYIVELSDNVAKANTIVHYHINIDALKVQLDISKAMPCGMIINELITNSFKHFQKDGTLIMDIYFTKKNDGYVLEFQDNGVGIEPYDNSVSKNTLGMILIEALSDQLDGKIVIENRNGFYFQLQFNN